MSLLDSIKKGLMGEGDEYEASTSMTAPRW